MSKLFYTTMAGVQVYYEPVSTQLIELSERGIRNKHKKAGKPVEVPTYTVNTAGGGSQDFPYDAEYAKTNDDTMQIWAAHLAAVQEMNQEIMAARNRILMRAIKVDLPTDTTWMRVQKRDGVEFDPKPEREQFSTDDDFQDALDDYHEDLRAHYISTEIIKTVEDTYGLMGEIMAASMKGALSEEQIQAASASFRNTLQDAKRELNPVGNDNGKEGRLDS